jgi:hypothetical protein
VNLCLADSGDEFRRESLNYQKNVSARMRCNSKRSLEIMKRQRGSQ